MIFGVLVNWSTFPNSHTQKLIFFSLHLAYSLFMQTAVCSECFTSKHRQHPCERLADIDRKLREDLQGKCDTCKIVKEKMDDDIQVLQERLQDIYDDVENNRSTIEEVFNSFRAFLDEIKDSLLKQNKNLHTLLEMKVLENMEVGQRTIVQIDQALSLASNYLRSGTDAQLAVVYATIVQWMAVLSRRSISTQVSTGVPFHSDLSAYKNNIKRAFGYFGEPPTPSGGGGLSSFGSQGSEQLQQHFNNQLQAAGAATAAVVNGGRLSTGCEQEADSRSLSSPTPSISPSDTAAAIHSAADAIMSAAAGLGPDIFGSLTSATGVSAAAASQTSPTASDSGLSDHSVLSASVVGGTKNLLGGFALDSHSLTSLASAGTGLGRALVSGAMSDGRSVSPRSTTPMDPILNCSTFGLDVSSGGALSPTLLASLSSGSSGSSTGNAPLAKPGMAAGAGFNPNPNPPFANRSGRCATMSVRHRWGSLGSNRAQFNSPHGFCLGMDEEIVVADTQNHRIQVFDKTGEFKYMFGVPGREEGQLWYPRKVAVMRASGRFVVCDRGNERSRMQIFNKNGHFSKKIAIRYIDIVAGLAINNHGHIVAVGLCISDSLRY